MSTAPPPVSRTGAHGGIDSIFEIRTTQSNRTHEPSTLQAQLLVLSRNPELVEVVRNAARSVAQVAQARDLDDAVRTLPNVDPGVLLIDDAITNDVATTIVQITRRYPEAVMVIVGTREESSELMQLVAAGRVFRFLLMPLSFGPVRLALTAAVTHHIECTAAGRSIGRVAAEAGHSGRKRALIYTSVAVALLITIGGLWRVSGLLVTKPAAPAATVTSVRQTPAAVTTLESNPLLAQLQRATEAMVQGHYVEPAGSSALELYRSVLQADPNSEAARDGIRAIADEFMVRAEQAILTESLDEAQRLLTLVRSIEADHPRLEFLDGSLARERELRNLSERRDASNRIRQLVEAARSAMLAGDLIGSGSGGAAASLIAARKLDPVDPAVSQNVRDLNTALADAVRAALDAGDNTRARALATAASKLGAGDQLLVAVSKRTTPPPIAASVPPIPAMPSSVERSEPSPVASTIVPAAGELPAAEEVLQAATLPRTRQVMPTYPATAAMEGIEGYVDLEFTIATDGVPRNFNVLSATPKRVFDSAAVSCVRQWRFEPIKQNGFPVSRRATLRVRFQLR